MLKLAKRSAKRLALYDLARRLRRGFGRTKEGAERTVVALKPLGPSQGNVLLSYIIDPFLLRPGEPVSTAHTHDWESLQIARTFLDLGYAVDAISYQNNTFVPKADYAFLIDARWNLERLSPLLNRDCVKVMHIDTAHLLFHNAAESRRLLELQQRRGVTLRPRRFEMPNRAIEHSDRATILGNDFTIGTYSYANKPLHPVPISTTALYSWPADKDFEGCRKRFLWFGSGGMVHKGLDLVLEAFAAMPDYRLDICGPVDQEEDFAQAYHKELYETRNIRTLGWLDVAGPQFIELTRSCVALIYPSCSEGQSGSVVNCMHAGLIPVISYESGVDVHAFGLILRRCSVAEIKESVQSISELSATELRGLARQTWEFARSNHTRADFSAAYTRAVTAILADRGRPALSFPRNAPRPSPKPDRSDRDIPVLTR